MAHLSKLTDPSAVRMAMAEYDRIGQDAFLEKYGYRPARSIFLKDGGRRYDSKAIIGVAYGYQYPKEGPLTSGEFVGGADVVRRLKILGFDVVED